jgi:hypothetical protein
VLSYQLLPPLVGQLSDGQGNWTKLSMLRNATWTVSNLLRGKPPPRWELVAPAVPLLAQLILHEDEEVIVDACWALSYVSEPPERIQARRDVDAYGARRAMQQRVRNRGKAREDSHAPHASPRGGVLD